MILRREPALFVSLVGALINLLVVFGVPMTTLQTGALNTSLLAAVAFVIRSQVTPVSTLPPPPPPGK